MKIAVQGRSGVDQPIENPLTLFRAPEAMLAMAIGFRNIVLNHVFS